METLAIWWYLASAVGLHLQEILHIIGRLKANPKILTTVSTKLQILFYMGKKK